MPEPYSQHCHHYYGVTSLLSSHPERRRLRRNVERARLHGSKVWPASYLMMHYLQQHPLPTNCNVMEVGCGWGLSGIYCATHFAARVIACDADDAVKPLLELHARHNKVALDWRQASFTDLKENDFSDLDVLLASDICFWDSMAEDVYSMLACAIDAGVPRILIADPLRPPFIALAEACVADFYAELVPVEAQSSRHHRGAVLVIENA